MDIATYRQRWIENVTGDRPGVDFWAADVDGRLAGYAIGGPYRPRNDAGPDVVTELAELYAIYVDPPRQGCGAGTAVHDALLAALAEQGYSEVALWVLVDNEPGRRWYARRGWTPDGAVAMWSAGDSILPELRMRRGLPGPCAARLG
jgi:GNAT superfamily N-acetyltransferase